MALLLHACFVWVILLYQVAGETRYATCPEGWLAGQGSCYLFDTHLESYDRAEMFCQYHDGHLVRIDNSTENDFLKNYLKMFKENAWWIGLSDRAQEEVWQWKNYGLSESNIFTDWFPGQPDDYFDQDCAIFNNAYHYRWTDETCSKPHFSICEIR